ncbi:MAG: hypothetical protein CME71_12160 [Halobacteriovorax sp.]|nr:hypothetical protein [Halobacteriovorax sp.]
MLEFADGKFKTIKFIRHSGQIFSESAIARFGVASFCVATFGRESRLQLLMERRSADDLLRS